MRNKTIVPLRAEEELDWKNSTIDYLKGLLDKPFPNALGQDLMHADALIPVRHFKGDLLLQPGKNVDTAWFLRKGLVKMYYYTKDGNCVLVHIWDGNSIVVLFRKFKTGKRNRKYYIEVMEDSELVGISSATMQLIYAQHPFAQELTDEILARQTQQEELQKEILQMTDRKERYKRLKELFPEFLVHRKWRLTNAEICMFIGISVGTLAESRKLYPEGV
ncbi:Crp/Fnr family transcriptional regulator [Pedobacter sp. JY14-1]|uniref:Crp/Fnr family transcriptional regulator n=1 Tax=Pedobacter sp. JY14-1 TaxID=3034151 RepID=UPI0023E16677|nr:Crp/Fnr family transcriptional regulator [Pedobacter sp. JY14-1]